MAHCTGICEKCKYYTASTKEDGKKYEYCDLFKMELS